MERNLISKVTWGPISAMLGTFLIFVLPLTVIGSVSSFVDGFTYTSLDYSPWLQSLTQMIIGLAVVILTAAVVYGSGSKFSVFGFTLPSLKDLLTKLVIVLLIYYSILMLITLLMNAFLPEIILDDVQDVGFSDGLSGADLIPVIIALVIITPFFEEVLFRGFLFLGLRSRLPFWPAAIITSLIFGLFHWNLEIGVDVFILSLGLCWLYENTRTIWAPILLHMLKNSVAFVLRFVAEM